MGEDKDRDVVGRIVAPPTGPALVPRAVAAPEHLAPHDVGADIREETADHFRVCCIGSALLTMLLPPAGRLEQPLVQADAAFPDRVLKALVRPSDKTVERDGDLARDGAHAFKTSSACQNHRSAPPSLSPGHALMTSRSRRWRTRPAVSRREAVPARPRARRPRSTVRHPVVGRIEAIASRFGPSGCAPAGPGGR